MKLGKDLHTKLGVPQTLTADKPYPLRWKNPPKFLVYSNMVNSHSFYSNNIGSKSISTPSHLLAVIQLLLGRIQSSVALPGDSAFDQKNNTYDIPSYKRLCNEFGISPSTDIRFHEGMNHGLGNIYIYYSNYGYGKTETPYTGTYKFSDEGGTASDGNLIQYITNQSSENQ